MSLQEKYKDNKELIDFLFEITKLIMAYGVPVAMALIKGLNESTITPERIEKTKLDKKPLEFFPCLKDE